MSTISENRIKYKVTYLPIPATAWPVHDDHPNLLKSKRSNVADNDNRLYLLKSKALISADNDDCCYLLHSNALISADWDDRYCQVLPR